MDFSPQKEFDSQEFKGLTLDRQVLEQVSFLNCTFSRCFLRETHLQACKLRECTFKNCDLSLAALTNTHLTQVRFESCQLIGINWTEAVWPGRAFYRSVDFEACVLNHSTFMGLNLKQILLRRCSVHDVDFSEANLTQADCSASDFSNSRFVHTNLSQANFSGASHYAISPNLNTLKKTQFSLPEAMSLLYGLDIVLTDPDSPTH